MDGAGLARVFFTPAAVVGAAQNPPLPRLNETTKWHDANSSNDSCPRSSRISSLWRQALSPSRLQSRRLQNQLHPPTQQSELNEEDEERGRCVRHSPHLCHWAGASVALVGRFVCTVCGHRGADVRPLYEPARMGADRLTKAQKAETGRGRVGGFAVSRGRAMSFKARCVDWIQPLRRAAPKLSPVLIGLRLVRSPTARMTTGIETMKKCLLGTVGSVAFGMAAPATAADLAPYTKTSRPAPYVSPIYEWTGFYIGANGGWDSSHSCVDFLDVTGVQCR